MTIPLLGLLLIASTLAAAENRMVPDLDLSDLTAVTPPQTSIPDTMALPYHTTMQHAGQESQEPLTLYLHAFFPIGWTSTDRRTAVLFFHGLNGSPKQFWPQCDYFVRRGCVALTAEYRQPRQHGADHAAALADARHALRFITHEALRLGVDAQRVVVGGGSYGGWVAAMLLTDPVDADGVGPAAAILYNPLVDLLSRLPADADELARTTAAALSPLHQQRKGLAPCIIFHGTADEKTPFADVELMQQRSRAFGNTCQLVAYRDVGHGFYNHQPAKTQCNRQSDAFLTALRLVEGVHWISDEAVIDTWLSETSAAAPAAAP